MINSTYTFDNLLYFVTLLEVSLSNISTNTHIEKKKKSKQTNKTKQSKTK